MSVTEDIKARLTAGNEGLLRFETFESVACALNDAGVDFVASGNWSLEYRYAGPPMWEGVFYVRSHPDTIVRVLAAFASLGYAPLHEVDAEVYADPRNLPDPEDFTSDDHPANIGCLKFLPGGGRGGPGVAVYVETPQEFRELNEDVELEEIVPGTPIRTEDCDALFRELGLLNNSCPQALADLACLSTTWWEELARAGCWYPGAPEPDPRVSKPARGRGPTRGGTPSSAAFDFTDLTLRRLAAVVRALNASRVPYFLNGAWRLIGEHAVPGEYIEREHPLTWIGHVVIARDLEITRTTFAALAAEGWVPHDEWISPESFVDLSFVGVWTEEDAEGVCGPLRKFYFKNTLRPGPLLWLVSLDPMRFEGWYACAKVEEVEPSLPAVVLPLRIPCSGIGRLIYPQSMRKVWALEALIDDLRKQREAQARRRC